MKQKIDYISGEPGKCIIKMTLPLLAALILSMAYSLVDSIWIGNMLGEKAMAALTSSTAVILLLTCITLGMTNGIAILLSQALGRSDSENECRIKTTSFILSLAVMIAVTLLCEIWIKPILLFLKTPDEIFDLAVWYLRLYLIGIIPSFFYMYFATILRCYGNPLFQMIGILAGTILNAVIDPIFIKMFGFNGAAIATIITQVLSMLGAILYVMKAGYFHISFKDYKRKTAYDIMVKAVPSVIQQSIPAISTMALTALVSGFGITAIAAFGIIGKMECILLYPVMALNMGLTTIVGQCIGAERTDKMADYIKTALRYGGISLFIVTLLVSIFSKNLSWLFIQSDDIGTIVRRYFIIAGAGYVIHALTTSFLAGLNGMGKTCASMFLYIFYFLCVRVPLAFVLAKSAGFGLDGIWSAVLISHFVAVLSGALLYHMEKRHMEESFFEMQVKADI